MTLSTFLAYLQTATFPAGILAEVRREARRRVIERLQVGHADSVLTFDDLIQRLEASLS